MDSGPREPRFLLLGLGNELCSDDAIGLLVVRELTRSGALSCAVAIRETTGAGLALLDELVGFDEAVLVDAVQTGSAEPGHVHVLDDTALPRVTLSSPHFLGVGETLALGRALELPVPAKVRIVAIEVADPYTIGTRLSPALAAALPGIVNQVTALVRGAAGPGSLDRPPGESTLSPCLTP